VAYAFPKITILTGALDDDVSHDFHIRPGFGNFGERGPSFSILTSLFFIPSQTLRC
jgi:hypothetical protein